MKNIYSHTIILFAGLLLFGCKKKESEQLGLKIDDIAKEWVLDEIYYENEETNKENTFNPYYDIKLTMYKGGRYEIDDIYSIINMSTHNGSGISNSVDVQKTYGLWEFTNESNPTQIAFNKGANTYSLWTESNYYDYYTFTDPEYVFDFELSGDKLTLTSTDYNLMYMYGFYIANDEAYNYCPDCVYSSDNYNDGLEMGEYFGYAGGYNDGALQVYNDSSESITVYRKDPFFNGYADGKLQNFYDFDYINLDLSTTPNYESGWLYAYWKFYNQAYDEAVLNTSRTTSDPGKIKLVFKVK